MTQTFHPGLRAIFAKAVLAPARVALAMSLLAGLSASTPAQSNTSQTAGDRTASIFLPPGWQITEVAHAALAASGPGGVTIHLGYTIPGIYDTVNPTARQKAMLASRAHTPFILCPFGGDLATSYRCVLQQLRKNEQLPPATVHVSKYPSVAPAPGETSAALIQANIYASDTGTVASTLRVGITTMNSSGEWTMTLSSVSAPQPAIASQSAALKQIVASFRQNGRPVPALTNPIVNNLLAQPSPLPSADAINPPR
jgi:hypothetical protein